jgi:peptidoglycan/xylan/chitin deacetylase (PgdA/CDA1 family)
MCGVSLSFPYIMAANVNDLNSDNNLFNVYGTPVLNITTLSSGVLEGNFMAETNYSGYYEFESMSTNMSGTDSTIRNCSGCSFKSIYMPTTGDAISVNISIKNIDYYDITFRVKTGEASSPTDWADRYWYYIDGVPYVGNSTNASVVGNFVVSLSDDATWGNQRISEVLLASGTHNISVKQALGTDSMLDYFTIYPSMAQTWSNVTKRANSTVDTSVEWCVYANNSINLWNNSCKISVYANSDSTKTLSYHLDEGSGTSAADSSGNGLTGAVSGALWSTGKYGSSLLFSGESRDRLSVSDSALLNPSDNFTLSAWVYLKSPTDFAKIFEKFGVGYSGYRLLIRNASGTSYYVLEYANTSGTIQRVSTSGSAIRFNTWQHLIGMKNGTNLSIYVDGSLWASQKVYGGVKPSTGMPFFIGYDNWNNEKAINGSIDEVAIWNRSLSASEISSLYSGSNSTLVYIDSPFSYVTLPVTDSISPSYSNCFSTLENNMSVTEGSIISLGCQWSDNLVIDSFLVSTKVNNSGIWSNSSWTHFDGNWSNITVNFPSENGSNLTVIIYVKDISGNQNLTTWFWWNPAHIEPIYSFPSIESFSNQTILSLHWTDNVQMSDAILSTNETGIWMNYTKPVGYSEELIPIIYYHAINETNPTNVSTVVLISNFTDQMDWIYRNNYHTITMAEMINYFKSGIKPPEKSVVISFDDGWDSQYINAYPILKARGFVATFYIITNVTIYNGTANDLYRRMNMTQVKELYDNGMEIGDHTKTHVILTNRFANYTQELNDSYNDIYSIIGAYPETFAYPQGIYNSTTEIWLKGLGFLGGARATENSNIGNIYDWRYAYLKNGNEGSYFNITSNIVSNSTTLIGSGNDDFIIKVKYTGRNEIENIYQNGSIIGSDGIQTTATNDSFSNWYFTNSSSSIAANISIPLTDYYDITFRVRTGDFIHSYNPYLRADRYYYYIDGLRYQGNYTAPTINDSDYYFTNDTINGIVWGFQRIANVQLTNGFHNFTIAANGKAVNLDYFSIDSSIGIDEASFYGSIRQLRTRDGWSNFTWQNNSVLPGTTIAWCVYANDVMNVWNNSCQNPSTFTV